MTPRLAALALGALTTAIATASCSGGGANHLLPGARSPQANAARAAQDVIVAPAGWAATATRAATIPGATDLGAVAPATPLTVRVGMNLHNESGLASLIASHQRITASQFAAQYGPTPSEVQSVVGYLRGQGFTNVQASGQLVSADGTAAQAAKAFDTTLESFQLNGAKLYVNTQPAFVPTSLGGVVSAVLGLNNAAKMTVHPALRTKDTQCFPSGGTPAGCLPLFDSAGVQKYYDAASLPIPSNTTMAVMAEGDVSGTVNDLNFARTQQGLPQVPVTVVKVGLSSPDTAGAGEWDLDTQSSTGMAGNVAMLFIYATTSLTDSDIASEYNRWATDDIAQMGNSSFGECEYQAWLDGSMKVDDNLFKQAAAQSQTMFASTGDTGSSCALAPTNGAPGSGPPMTEFPASSPYVVGVGGTSALANNDGTYAGETAWNAGGGGLSQFENSTSWQQSVQPTSTGLAATNLRSLPDIAMAADPNLGGYAVYGPNIPGVGACSSGCGIGGTSEASPLAMGAYARLQGAHANQLGFAALALYHNYLQQQNNAATVTGPPPTQALGGFHDIITGGNGLYTALPGYDYTTGLGTLDLSVMSAQIGT
ncbi:MAG TPA: S53 family peptidase [Candidatus Elarobacter sp.]|jgi:subtilase family serine protease|nr:S53 family peptidase [Candidatus Elarobacter sp.]